MRRLQVSLLLLAAGVAGGAMAGAAGAQPEALPDADWTFLREDNFKHYACRVASNPTRVRFATWFNNRQSAIKYDIGVYAVLFDGRRQERGVTRPGTAWRNGVITGVVTGAEPDDRLWVQGAYYGPPDRSEARRVSRLSTC